MFKIIRTEEFEKKMRKLLAPYEYRRITAIEAEIVENPFTGKPLQSAFLREKRINGKRAYFLVYSDLSLVVMVSISDKKRQQATIDVIKKLLPAFRKLAESAESSDSLESSSL